ncbi:MAG: OmpA family protein [Calditrichia bacterium]
MKKLIVLLTVMAFLIALIGCSASNKAKGGAIGAAAGGAAGAAIGKEYDNTILGAIIGAAVGGAAGTYIGNYMDKQAEEIEKDVDGANVERVGEGIRVTFDSGILFAVDKAELTPSSKDELNKMAKIFKKYEKTEVLIEGHTDATGSDEYNMNLSQRRAQSVANYLTSLGVDPARFTIRGYGENQPVATNETALGRQKNRRVELAIMADEELKQQAQQNAG